MNKHCYCSSISAKVQSDSREYGQECAGVCVGCAGLVSVLVNVLARGLRLSCEGSARGSVWVAAPLSECLQWFL